MTQKKLKPLKEKMEQHYEHLHKKLPLTKLIIESIDTLLEVEATDDLIGTWYKSNMIFIREIEKEIKNIERESTMTLEELKELKKRMIKNKAYLEERLSFTAIILDSLNILILNNANELMIEIWISRVSKEIEEIKEILDIIETNQSKKILIY